MQSSPASLEKSNQKEVLRFTTNGSTPSKIKPIKENHKIALSNQKKILQKSHLRTAQESTSTFSLSEELEGTQTDSNKKIVKVTLNTKGVKNDDSFNISEE